jgi:hypothetical protein
MKASPSLSLKLRSVLSGAGDVLWAYGVTCVPDRRQELLPATLRSLAIAGFPKPRLFVDGGGVGWQQEFLLPVSVRGELGVFSSWHLALLELYLREPRADRYALFQDDIRCSKRLREYLERCKHAGAYWNLFSSPANEQLAGDRSGWYPSNQLGHGALALVFARSAVQALLASEHMVAHRLDSQLGNRSVDGAVVCAMRKAGYEELVHAPSLVQHMGAASTQRPARHHRQSATFREDYDPCG